MPQWHGGLPDRDHALDFLLQFHGRVHVLACGYWLKFEAWHVSVTREIPHGVRYALSLHDRDGQRVVGFDNAHAVTVRRGGRNRRSGTYDHWHRTAIDRGRPYVFVDGATLIADFFEAVKRELTHRGLRYDVVEDRETL